MNLEKNPINNQTLSAKIPKSVGSRDRATEEYKVRPVVHLKGDQDEVTLQL